MLHFRTGTFQHRAFRPYRLTCRQRREYALFRGIKRFDTDLHLRELARKIRVIQEITTRDTIDLGQLAHLLQHVAKPRRIGIAALELKEVLCVCPSLVLLANQGFRYRNAYILEEDLIDFLLAFRRAVERGQS